jgi:hypothetical protein
MGGKVSIPYTCDADVRYRSLLLQLQLDLQPRPNLYGVENDSPDDSPSTGLQGISSYLGVDKSD